MAQPLSASFYVYTLIICCPIGVTGNGGFNMRIVDRENNEVQIIVRLKADLKSALDDIAGTLSVSRNLLLNEIIAKAILNFNYGKEHSVDEK